TGMYRRALALDPAIDRSIVARYVVAQVSLLITELNRAAGPVEAARAREMIDRLRHLLELQPDSVHANYLFGLLNHGLGRTDVAREAYLAALADQPGVGAEVPLARLQEMAQKVSSGTAVAFGTDEEEALRKKTLPGPMREYRHGGFIVKHRNAVIARRVALAAEYHARRLFDLFGIKQREDLWPVPCTIILHPDRKTYVREEKQPGWSPAVARFRRRGGKLETLELATYQQAVELIPCVVPHELTHLVVDSVFPNQTVPLWLNEGLAVSQEQDYKKQHILGDMLNHVRLKTDIPFDELVRRTTYPKANLVNTYYAQSLVLTEVLLQAGDMNRLRRFVRLVQDEPLDKALRGSFDLSLAELERRYRAAVTMVDRRLNHSVVQPVE
ncbi:MAG: tetratricopeptide repeat protein, partial [Planctomycetota bacterium]